MNTDLTPNEAQLFALKAKLVTFKLSHTLDLWSLLMAVIASLGLFFTPVALSVFQAIFGLSLVLSLAQKVYAIRVQYDIALFEAWLSVKSPTLHMLDDALQAQFGIKTSGASLEQRISGLKKLFDRQIIANATQSLLCLIGIGIYLLR